MRCTEFYDKIAKDKDLACRIDPDTLRNVSNYIDLSRELELVGVPQETTNVVLSENATRPLFKKKNAYVKDNVISNLEIALKDIHDTGKTTRLGKGFKNKITQREVNNLLFKEKCRLKVGVEDSNPIPDGRYNVILADPPWRYDFSVDDNDQIENHYQTMSLDEIKDLNVPAADNSILFLWATMPKLKEALDVVEAWGFEYKSGPCGTKS